MAGRPAHPQELQRRVVARHLRSNGATYREIADVLGVAPTTAWQLVQRSGPDPAPPTVTGRNGGRYPSRRRPVPEPVRLACETCSPVDGQHDSACPLRHLARELPRPVNRGGPGRGLTPPSEWPVILGKLAAGSTHREVAAAYGVSRPRITAIVARVRASGPSRRHAT